MPRVNIPDIPFFFSARPLRGRADEEKESIPRNGGRESPPLPYIFQNRNQRNNMRERVCRPPETHSNIVSVENICGSPS